MVGVLVLVILGVVVWQSKSGIDLMGRQCFKYSQEATKTEPYAVTEYMDLTFDETGAGGIKTGNQSGPDMTIGYTGTISGHRNDSTLNMVYQYTIEGSVQQEAEEYLIDGEDLIRLRWPLHDLGDMLLPDKSGTAKRMLYEHIDCSELGEDY